MKSKYETVQGGGEELTYLPSRVTLANLFSFEPGLSIMINKAQRKYLTQNYCVQLDITLIYIYNIKSSHIYILISNLHIGTGKNYHKSNLKHIRTSNTNI